MSFSTEQNPWDGGDVSYNHQTSVLSGDMKIAMIAENSIASGAGIAVVDGVEIPTVDQLGNSFGGSRRVLFFEWYHRKCKRCCSHLE